MYYISHRGNINGKDIDNENKPEYINIALSKGFDVEIDVWLIDNKLYLGHDEACYEIEPKFLYNNNLWCHAKNYDALEYMLERNIHCFWHENDLFTITSKGFIWQYPSDVYYSKSVFLMPEYVTDFDSSKCYGICSDFIGDYSKE